MSRLLMLIEPPEVVSRQAAADWLRAQAARLAERSDVISVTTSDLRSPMPALGCDWRWLIELRVAHADQLEALAATPAVIELVGELRALGLRPVVIAVDADAPS